MTDLSATHPHPNGNGSGRAALTEPLLLRRVGHIDPKSIDDYISQEGYAALRRTVSDLSPEVVVAEVAKAGLRGRGGAGFDAATKWRAALASPSIERYVIANAFGADPVARGDRALLEGDPHAVLEGLAIAAYAIGANRAFVYCCSDDSEALQRVGTAIRQAEERGFLGSSVLGSEYSLHVSVVAAPSGFAAGEETATIALIEGKRPMPAERPPYPAEAGLWGKPTVVNNAETLANVPWIVQNGAERFKALGSDGNSGTKLVTIVGPLNRSGVVEVPFGTSLAEVIARYAGGLRDGGEPKAVQVGGPTGGLVPSMLLDTKLEFESLVAAGGHVGSGSVLVLDRSACVLDFLRSQLQLLASESCGRCVPGRLGTKRLSFIVEQIANGEGRPGDLDILAEIGQNMADGAVCGYGITAANPVRTALRHFREEIEAHVVEKRCPTGTCSLSATSTPERREELWRRRWPIRR